jgi:hypothetical protein
MHTGCTLELTDEVSHVVSWYAPVFIVTMNNSQKPVEWKDVCRRDHARANGGLAERAVELG